MPSSTSNSDRRQHPAGPWGRTWLLAVVLAVAACAAEELLLRRAGHRPSVVDDATLWACHRDRVYPEGAARPVVVLGASRVQLGFAPAAFQRRCPAYRAVQLALDGSSPVATLADLAGDERFGGIVLCSLAPPELAGHLRSQQPHVDHYRRLFANYGYVDKVCNRRIATLLQQRLAVVNPIVSPRRIIESLARDRILPRPWYLVTHSDRSRSADYTKIDIVRHRRERIDRVRQEYLALGSFSPEQWAKRCGELRQMVERIRARGGQVVFVRYPTTDEHLELDRRHFPRSAYWDTLAELTGAVTVHFADSEGLRGYDCPDTSHLDSRDVPRFTVALADELIRRGVLKP